MAKPNVKHATPEVTGVEVMDTVPASNVRFPDGSPATNVEPETLETFLAEAEALGEVKGAGDETLAQLGIKLCKASHVGYVKPHRPDMKTPASETNPDHVAMAFDRFLKGKKAKSIHERKDLGNKVSQLRNFAILGANKNIDGPAILDTAVEQYEIAIAETASDEKARKLLRDAYTAYLEVAKLQKAEENEKRALSVTQIKSCMSKTPKEVATPKVAEIWAEIAKLTTALVDGSRKDGVVDKDTASAALALSIKAHADEVAKREKALDQIATFRSAGVDEATIATLEKALAVAAETVATAE